MKTERPLISVIVPVYNGESFLEACISSIVNQTYEKLEIIIVDDGSSDGTWEICQELKKNYPNMILLHKEDEGVSAARNAAVGISKGQYISFVDADDRILPQMLEYLYNALVETDSEIAGCGFFSWNSEQEWENNKKETEGKDGQPEKKVFLKEAFIKEGLLVNDTRCWSKLFRKEAVRKVMFREGLSIGEDMLFLVDMLPHIQKIVTISYAGYGYFQNPAGAMNRSFQPDYMDQITCWEMAREKLMQYLEKDKEYVLGKVTTKLIMAAMLIVGKIAALPSEGRKENQKYIDTCHDLVRNNCKVRQAFSGLSLGYKIKVLFFKYAKGLYVTVYGRCRRN